MFLNKVTLREQKAMLTFRFTHLQIKYNELSSFSEVLACGTGVTLVPIKSITRKSTSDIFVYQNDSTEPGPCAQLLGTLLDNIYKGKTEDKFGWLAKVKEPEDKANGMKKVNGKTH